MGCWNATCGISQLPILGGRKVKCFILLQSKFTRGIQGSGSCSPSEYFRPWFFPVAGKYNYYGSIESINDDWNSQYILEKFQGFLKDESVVILGNDECEINSPEITDFNGIKDIFDCIERGALVFKKDGQSFKISMFMILEDVYDGILSYLRGIKDDYNTSRREKVFKAISTSRNENPDIKELVYYVVCTSFSDIIEDNCVFNHYAKHVLEDGVDVKAVFDALDESKFICRAMHDLRKLWIPQCGQGSQSEEFPAYKALIAGMQAVLDKEAKIEADNG